ncbi:oligosaccharide flippase family protein [Lonepinella sp. BR2919]|uniref:oligosaccharide flippase family protein n=1 Tax=unclassified Lonepinella TaxID=2642006 RepID=UPI003F6E1945
MKVIKDSIIYLAGEILAKMMPFFLLPYLSRKLGVEGFGELSYYQTYLALFLIIVGLSQDGAVSRYFYFYGKRSLNLIVNTGYAYTVVLGIIILLICFLLNSEILIYGTLAVLFQSFLNVQLSIRQCQKQAIKYTIIQFLSGVVSATTTVLLLELYSDNLVEKRILAMLISNFLVFSIAYFLYKSSNKIYGYKSFSIKDYKMAFFYIMGFGTPLIFHNISIFLKGQLDRIVIFTHFTNFELGIYSAASQVSSVVLVLFMAINKATVPYYFESIKNGVITFGMIKRWFFYSILISPCLFLVCFFIPENLYLFLLGTEYIGVKYYICIFILSISLNLPYFLLVNFLFFYAETRIISICSVFSTMVYIVFLIVFSNISLSMVPFSSLLGNLVILPILFLMVKKVKIKRGFDV